MTEDELKRLEALLKSDDVCIKSGVEELEAAGLFPGEWLAEIRRLRDLVRNANSIQPVIDTCPWCVGILKHKPEHQPDCPAFTPDGEVC